jgi:membrane protein DedA with SNARE-associated domain
MFDRIIEFLNGTGYFGIAALMFLENLFPPIPSEIVMPSAGFSAGQGRLSLVGVIVAGTLGSVAGALFWYYVGRWIGDERLKRWAGQHGRWLTLSPGEVDKVDRWFERHCSKAVLFGRLVPTIRTLISVPAGVFGMSLSRFLLFTAIGTAAWTAALALAGYLLEDQYRQVSDYLNPVANVVIALIVVTYLYRVVTWKPE